MSGRERRLHQEIPGDSCLFLSSLISSPFPAAAPLHVTDPPDELLMLLLGCRASISCEKGVCGGSCCVHNRHTSTILTRRHDRSYGQIYRRRLSVSE